MKTWLRPQAVVDDFAANVSVSTCDPTAVGYRFECNAKEGRLYAYPRGDGKIDGIYTGNEKPVSLGYDTPCGKKHNVKKNDVFYDGFIDYNRNGHQDPGEGVIIWQEEKHGPFGIKYNNYHATTKLDVTQWEKAMS